MDLQAHAVAHPPAVVADRAVDHDPDVVQHGDGQVVASAGPAEADLTLAFGDGAVDRLVDLPDGELVTVDGAHVRPPAAGAGGARLADAAGIEETVHFQPGVGGLVEIVIRTQERIARLVADDENGDLSFY